MADWSESYFGQRDDSLAKLVDVRFGGLIPGLCSIQGLSSGLVICVMWALVSAGAVIGV